MRSSWWACRSGTVRFSAVGTDHPVQTTGASASVCNTVKILSQAVTTAPVMTTPHRLPRTEPVRHVPPRTPGAIPKHDPLKHQPVLTEGPTALSPGTTVRSGPTARPSTRHEPTFAQERHSTYATRPSGALVDPRVDSRQGDVRVWPVPLMSKTPIWVVPSTL